MVAARGADAARAPARAGAGAATSPTRHRCARRSARPCSRALADAAHARARASSRRSPPVACDGWSRRCCAPQRVDARPRARCVAARGRTPCWRRRCGGSRSATGSAELTPASLPAALEALDAALDGIELGGALTRFASRRAADARGRPAALPAPRGRARGGARAEAPRVALRARGRRARAAPARRAVDHRPRRPRRRRPGRRGDRPRLQGRNRAAGRRLGGGRVAPGRALHARGARAARPRARGRALPGPVGPRSPPARPGPRRRAGQVRGAGTSCRSRSWRPRWPTCASGPCRPRASCRRARSARVRRGARRRGARIRRSAGRADEGRRMTVVFTSEQRAAIADRGGLARCSRPTPARARRRSWSSASSRRFCATGCRSADPRADVHGEGRRRVAGAHPAAVRGVGEDEHARAVDAAWIGTIHGFCARVLRSQPLAAGLDPRFTVLDEGAARAARARRVRARAGGLGGRRAAGRRSTSPRPTAGTCGNGARRPRRRCASRGVSAPRLPVPPAAPAARPGRARRAARRGRARPGRAPATARRRSGARRARGLRAAARRRRRPAARRARGGRARTGAKALEQDAVRRLPRRPGRPTARPAPTTTPAPRSVLLDDLLAPLRRRRTGARRPRAPGSTSTTSSWASATCSPPTRAPAPAGPSASR